MELVILGLVIILIVQSAQILSKFKELKKDNARLRDLLAEQSEVIRKIKVEIAGVEHVKDLPPGTDLDDVKIKDKTS